MLKIAKKMPKIIEKITLFCCSEISCRNKFIESEKKKISRMTEIIDEEMLLSVVIEEKEKQNIILKYLNNDSYNMIVNYCCHPFTSVQLSALEAIIYLTEMAGTVCGKKFIKKTKLLDILLNYINNPELHGDLIVRTASYSCSLLFYKCGLDEHIFQKFEMKKSQFFTGCSSNMMIQNYCSQILG